jgi:hypothetical protein
MSMFSFATTAKILFEPHFAAAAAVAATVAQYSFIEAKKQITASLGSSASLLSLSLSLSHSLSHCLLPCLVLVPFFLSHISLCL